jgi:hypothetical protein
MAVVYHPMDFAKLSKGDVLTPEMIAKITGKQPGTEKYALALMGLRERIMRECRKLNNPITAVCSHESIRILTDAESAHYNAEETRRGFRKQCRAFRRLTEVDARELDDQQKTDLERNIIITGKMIAAARSARSIAISAHKRSTPGLTAPSKLQGEAGPAEARLG